MPLRLDPSGLPSWLTDRYPDYVGAESFRLNWRDAWRARDIGSAGQVAVAAYDDLGRLVQATNVVPLGRVPR